MDIAVLVQGSMWQAWSTAVKECECPLYCLPGLLAALIVCDCLQMERLSRSRAVLLRKSVWMLS